MTYPTQCWIGLVGEAQFPHQPNVENKIEKLKNLSRLELSYQTYDLGQPARTHDSVYKNGISLLKANKTYRELKSQPTQYL